MYSIHHHCEQILNVGENQANSNKEFICKHFLQQVNESASTRELLEELFRCRGNKDRVALVSKYFKWTPLEWNIRGKYEKDPSVSSLFRQLGNEAREDGKLHSSIQLFSMAVLFAPAQTAELGLAYAGRSVALQQLDLTQEAIKDIDLALTNAYPTDRNAKLMKRRMRYEATLMSQERSQMMMMSNQGFKRKLKRTEALGKGSIFVIKRPNSVMPSASDAIKLMISPVHGRHLVANRPIPLGTTIMVETPFVSALENTLNWDMKHCHHCLAKVYQSVPCPSCVFAIYCDEHCRQKAYESYHQYECPCLPELHCNLADPLLQNFHLVFKLICQLGPTALYRLYLKGETGSLDGIPGVNSTTGIYDGTSYETVYNLIAHINPHEGYYFVLVAIILTYTLRWNSHFFAQIDDESVEPFQEYIASLMLRHFEAFRRNLFSFEEVVGADACADGPEEFGLTNYAVGVLPTMSLINHSCHPNAVLVSRELFGKSGIVTVRSIQKGEQVTISYGPHYGDCHGTSSRRGTLQAAYSFLCICAACLEDWSNLLLKQLSSSDNNNVAEHVTFKCTWCFGVLTDGERSFKCNSCQHQIKRQSILKEYSRHKEVLTRCERYIYVDHNTARAIPLLKESLEYFERNCCQPCCYSVMGQKLLREALALCVNY